MTLHRDHQGKVPCVRFCSKNWKKILFRELVSHVRSVTCDSRVFVQFVVRATVSPNQLSPNQSPAVNDPSNTNDTINIESSQKSNASKHRKNYSRSLTIHGASRVLTGTKVEKLFWSTLVLASLSFTLFLTHETWKDFFMYKVKIGLRLNT